VANQRAEITWSKGVPVSVRYGDPYYSLENGLAETEHVFLAGNGLPDRFKPGFRIAELGFGTGLNLLVALRAAQTAGMVPLRYTGFEAHPISPFDMEAALAAFPELTEDAARLVAAWREGSKIRWRDLEADIIIGNAAATLPDWTGLADAWFLDGFAPARNPDLWTPDILTEAARHTTPGGTAATYTAAGHVRRSLAAAGFEVTRRAGYGRKRHMTVATRLG
jgi:tRNA U34 5-methylaminomethyl-2-thiouridine-forming methyltransferase MnmC